MPRWRDALNLVADLVFPRSCPGCDRTLTGQDDAWCRQCAEHLLKAAGADYCPRCGLPVGSYLVNPSGCAACRTNRNRLDGIARVGSYSGMVGEMVKKYKYGRRQRLDQALGSLLAAAVAGQWWRDQVEALVPVPTTWGSRLHYRFYPVGLLAAHVGHELSLPVLPLLYVRGKKRRQVELSHSERRRNVRGAFHLRRRVRVGGARLCVIDDVATTGSTLCEVARALKRAGAARVYAATLAKTNPSEPHTWGA